MGKCKNDEFSLEGIEYDLRWFRKLASFTTYVRKNGYKD
jgi:hypothetical protein